MIIPCGCPAGDAGPNGPNAGPGHVLPRIPPSFCAAPDGLVWNSRLDSATVSRICGRCGIFTVAGTGLSLYACTFFSEAADDCCRCQRPSIFLAAKGPGEVPR